MSALWGRGDYVASYAFQSCLGCPVAVLLFVVFLVIHLSSISQLSGVRVPVLSVVQSLTLHSAQWHGCSHPGLAPLVKSIMLCLYGLPLPGLFLFLISETGWPLPSFPTCVQTPRRPHGAAQTAKYSARGLSLSHFFKPYI